MRNYVKAFLNRYQFDETGKTVLLNAFDGLPSDKVTEIVALYQDEHSFDFTALTALVDELKVQTGIHEYTLKMLAVIMWGKRLEELYVERGFGIDLAVDILRDVQYKYKECMQVYGIPGVFAWEWYICIFRLRCFALGRLEFEIKEFEKPCYEKDGMRLLKGDRVINIHIPNTGTPLRISECEEAFALARSLFSHLFSGEKIPFTCHSWLLHVEHKNILPANSNIRAFMDLFDMIEHGEFDSWTRDGWRVFGVADDCAIEQLPENTSLQRIYKNHLLSDGKLGWGYGVLFR